jgi:thiol:disulfide interchange protein DsbA
MFFTYGCRHCLAVEPLISQWEASLSPKVRLRRLPFALWDDFIILQDLYFAMDALGLVAQLHARVYHAVQGERRRLETEDQIGEFVARQGLDVHQFISTLNSDAVAARTRDASELAGRFEVSDIPTFVVGHRWKTDVPRAGSINKALAVVDFLARSGR